MNNAIYNFNLPSNEKLKSYAPGTPERKQLKQSLEQQVSGVVDIPLIIGGKAIETSRKGKIVMPHNHRHVLGTYSIADPEEIELAIQSALKAREDWMTLS